MILHIAISEKFLPPFIALVDEHFDSSNHLYAFITSEKYEYGLKPAENVCFFHTDSDFTQLAKLMKDAHKIILHGIWRDKVNRLLVQNPDWFKKVYWFMWGGEYYFPERYDDYHKEVIKKAAYLVVSTPADVDMVRSLYGAEGEYIEGAVYAKFEKVNESPFCTPKQARILVGNSAAKTNFHIETVQKLKEQNASFDKLVMPLSYGGPAEYVDEVAKLTSAMVGKEKVELLKDFLSLEGYIALLSSIDIAIFNQNRQQAVNNILLLLEMGKKVYLRRGIATFTHLVERGFAIFPFDEFNTDPLTPEQVALNQKLIKQYYSEPVVVGQLERIFLD